MDSRTTSWPRAITPASAREAFSSGPRSGSRLRVSGVGTQTRIASASCSSTKRRGEAAALEHGAEALGRDVLDVRAALAQRGDLGLVDVDADDVEPGLGEADRQRQPDVAHPDDSDAHPGGPIPFPVSFRPLRRDESASLYGSGGPARTAANPSTPASVSKWRSTWTTSAPCCAAQAAMSEVGDRDAMTAPCGELTLGAERRGERLGVHPQVAEVPQVVVETHVVGHRVAQRLDGQRLEDERERLAPWRRRTSSRSRRDVVHGGPGMALSARAVTALGATSKRRCTSKPSELRYSASAPNPQPTTTAPRRARPSQPARTRAHSDQRARAARRASHGTVTARRARRRRRAARTSPWGRRSRALQQLQVRVHHQPDQLLEARLRLPAQLALGLRRVARPAGRPRPAA